ncbi:hypothetical protein MTO96_015261 [Rhipicephalus appendiculatus]
MSTETSSITPSGDSNKPDSTSGKEPSETRAVAGTHPLLSPSGTLSSGSMPEIIADDSMSVSARTAALAESLSRGPSSQASDPASSLGTTSESDPAVILDPPDGLRKRNSFRVDVPVPRRSRRLLQVSNSRVDPSQGPAKLDQPRPIGRHGTTVAIGGAAVSDGRQR